MAKPRIKIVNVPHGFFFDNPNQGKINKAVVKWEKQGYKLHTTQDQPVGCFGKWITAGWARGKTVLTFHLEDQA